MPDVLQIAIERRQTLLSEIKALDKFIRTANELLAHDAAKEARKKRSKPVVSLKPAPLPNGDTPGEATISKTIQPMADDAPAQSQTEAFLRTLER